MLLHKLILLGLVGTNGQHWNQKLLFVWMVRHRLNSSGLAFPDVPTHSIKQCTSIRTKEHPPHTLYLTNLQLGGSPDCVFSKVQLASFQSAVEHIPCLCFLYRPIRIFPLIASLLQVSESEREKSCLQIMNRLLPPFSLSNILETPARS